MTKRVFVWAWLAFGTSLLLPVVLFVVPMVRVSMASEMLLGVSYALLAMSPTLFGVAVSLHTINTRRFTRAAQAICGAHVIASLWPFAVTVIRDGSILPDPYYYDRVFGWEWSHGVQVTLALILVMRLITSWAPSFWSRTIRALALAFLGLAILLVGYVTYYSIFIQPGYVDQIVNPATPIVFSVIGAALTGIAVLWSSTERALGKRWRKEESTLEKRVPVHLDCPKCSRPMDVLSHVLHRCSRCGLGVDIRIHEPRCSCGYLLYGFNGDVCPECGVTVPDDLRWWDANQTESAHPPLGDGEAAAGAEGD